MSRKRLDPSEAELRASAYSWLHEQGIGIDEVPAGWVCIQKVMRLKGLSVGQAESWAKRGLREKTLQMKQFRIQTDNGVRMVKHYFKK